MTKAIDQLPTEPRTELDPAMQSLEEDIIRLRKISRRGLDRTHSCIKEVVIHDELARTIVLRMYWAPKIRHSGQWHAWCKDEPGHASFHQRLDRRPGYLD